MDFGGPCLWGVLQVDKADQTDSAVSASDLEGARARVELGLAYDNGGGMYSEIVGFYDGIGASGYESYGASLTFNLDF